MMEITNNIKSCTDILKAKNLSVAFAESASAGQVMAAFSLIENAGEFLKGGVVCYDVSVKETLLKVPASLIEQYTAESTEVTRALAQGLRKLIDADIYIAVTGLPRAGGSETEDKPVGTMFIHLIYHTEEYSTNLIFEGDCELVIEKTVSCVASILKKFGDKIQP